MEAGCPVLLAAAALATSPDAAACGGFFCSQRAPVSQTGERILFADNGDGTTTAVIQIRYQGPSENFAWLLPVSSVPEEGQLALGSNLAFQRLQQATDPSYTLDVVQQQGLCRPDPEPTFPPPPPAPVAPASARVEAEGTVGPFEWTVLRADLAQPAPAAAVVQWLGDNGYDVSEFAPDLLGSYLEQGRYVLALRLTKEASVGDIRPIMITFAGSQPDIPLRLTQVAATPDMDVRVWLAGSARAVPLNYDAIELNETRIDWLSGGSNYEALVSDAANEASGGHGFVTEFAAPAAVLHDVVWSAKEESDWEQLRLGMENNSLQDFYAAAVLLNRFDGYAEAVREATAATAQAGGPPADTCAECLDSLYVPEAIVVALEKHVVAPMRSMQRLVDGQAVVTRLFTKISAAEMNEDPVFGYNPNLGEVRRDHTADLARYCGANVVLSRSDWSLTLPDGQTVQRWDDRGSWAERVGVQPASRRILRMSTSGPGVVLIDNAEQIEAELRSAQAAGAERAGRAAAAADAALGSSAATETVPLEPGPMRVVDRDSCALSAGVRSRSGPLGLLLGGSGVLAAWRRRSKFGGKRAERC